MKKPWTINDTNADPLPFVFLLKNVDNSPNPIIHINTNPNTEEK